MSVDLAHAFSLRSVAGHSHPSYSSHTFLTSSSHLFLDLPSFLLSSIGYKFNISLDHRPSILLHPHSPPLPFNDSFCDVFQLIFFSSIYQSLILSIHVTPNTHYVLRFNCHSQLIYRFPVLPHIEQCK